MSKKYVYFFAKGMSEGNAGMKNLLGGKGANLHEMGRLGIRIPPGFTITTEVCTEYFKSGKIPEGVRSQVEDALKKLEEVSGKKFGDVENPLLVSVRSGARVSMPGMMDTILNLGLNDEVVKGLAKLTNNERFAYDCYRRFIQMFSDVVLKIHKDKFENRIDLWKKTIALHKFFPNKSLEELHGIIEKLENLGFSKNNLKRILEENALNSDRVDEIYEKLEKAHVDVKDIDLDVDILKKLVEEFKDIVKKDYGKEFPQEPKEQLWMAIEAVFKSWNNPRAIEYRKIYKIPDNWGTACNVQMMVFGNMGFDSGTGVAFTRNPSTGEKEPYGEYLLNAQGEDVVAGIRTPKPLKELEKDLPNAYRELLDIFDKLEKHYKDMLDLEFTIERGIVYMLQARVGKRTAKAAVKIAVDMVKEGLITKEEAVLRVSPSQLDQLLHPMIKPEEKTRKKAIAKGLPASPGAAVGKVIFTSEEAAKLGEKGEKVILVRTETSPDDIKGMALSQGILTSRGGMTSHAAVVARGMGKPAVVGAEEILIDYEKEIFKVKDVVVKKGDVITIDGSDGKVYVGELPLEPPTLSGEVEELLKWADEFRKLGVRTNADTPKDARKAREFGAEGIGLCRTEHMFFEGERIYAMQEMILAETPEERKKALEKLLPLQKEDFKAIFKEMSGLPVTIRTLDPPLHEFLPKEEEQIKEVAEKLGVSPERIKDRVKALAEANPMLGFRGCRLGVSYPEITEMQARAIFEAACEVKKEGYDPKPEIMIPLVGIPEELIMQKEIVDRVAKEVFDKYGFEIEYKVGTMIEVPRACVVADKIAKIAQFFSFGTNDLTQMVLGFSRDDVGKFLPKYIEKGILNFDPFRTLDKEGVGNLVKIAVEKGRSANKDLKIGVCGEHGGDPDSIEFFHKVGLDYVSASPYRVPIARLAAAQIALKEKMKH